MRRERVFLDTNILVYADDLDSGKKHLIAQKIVEQALASETDVISTQVLQEFFVTVTKKLRVAPEHARAKIQVLAALTVVRPTPDDILGAIDAHRLYHLSFWDALVLQCAAVSGCSRLLTEDMQHGQQILGVRIENPFLSGRSSK